MPALSRYEKIHMLEEDNVTILTLSDPSSDNALSDQLLEEFCDAVTHVTTSVLLLMGDGNNFSIGRPPQSYAASLDTLTRGYSLVMRANELVLDFPGVTIAAVRGRARGAGCSLAARCDLVLASETAAFSFPELRAGVPPVIVGSYFSRKLPWHAFLDLVLTGREVSAAEAQRLFLVTEVVPDHDLSERALQLARNLASLDAQTVATFKRFLHSSEGATTRQANRLGYATLLEALANRPTSVEGGPR